MKRQGGMLLKVWSRQHGLAAHPDSFNEDLLSAFAAHTAVFQQLVIPQPITLVVKH